MLQPKKVKYRKTQKDKGATKGVEHRGTTIAFGSFALKAMEGKWVTDKQLEAARVALTRHMKREGQVWIRVFPDKPRTAKPAEVRMGKGKGSPEGWVTVVRPGRILFEADGVPMLVAKVALKLAADKLPIETKFIVRADYKE